MDERSGGQQVSDDSGVHRRNGRVIWITGYSSAGKTTVGRLVEAELRGRGHSTMFLDGDDLRSIFSGRWGYSRTDRVELAKVYFRLCSHLASQGHIVVIAAVAMYREASRWLHENVPGVLEVFLDVPESERRSRDEAGKNVYAKVGDMTKLYDGPGDTALTLQNFGEATPAGMAQQIVAAFEEGDSTRAATYGRSEHWGDYYRSAKVPSQPSPFAHKVGECLAPESRVLEVGCGNGRDSAFFDAKGHRVVAIDASQAAVDLASGSHQDGRIEFHCGALPSLVDRLDGGLDAIYSRFVLHAMPLVEEEDLLDAAQHLLRPGGALYVECRSINDPMARLGEVISPTERIHGHYRRFIVKDELVDRLRTRGFYIQEVIESNGLAKHGDDDPIVIRIVARKA